MRKEKNSSTPQIEHAVGKAVNYEVTIADIARRSERRAWMVAFGAIGMSLILAGGYFYMLPLKEKVPYLIMADAYTGNATVARLRGDFNNNSITASEAINRANVATFVRARESYDLTLIGDRDWNTVFTMATPQVNSSYRALHSSRNPNAPSKIYGKNQAIRIKILSIQPFGSGGQQGARGANVRFQRSLFDKNSGTSRFLDNKIATLEYTYKNNLAMSDEMRMLNPLGFQVTAYRVDNDYTTTPAVGTEPAEQAASVPADAAGDPAANPALGPEEMPGMDLPAGMNNPGAPGATPSAAALPAVPGTVPVGAAQSAPGSTNQANGVSTR